MGALAVIDVEERDGHYRQRHEVQRWPVCIGRALDNDIVLDDPHVAAHHLDLIQDKGRIRFTVGETCNGVRINGQTHVAGGSGIWPGHSELHLGHTLLRLRTAAEPLPDEVRLFRAGLGLGMASILSLGFVAYAFMGWESWLGMGGEAVLWRVLAPLFIGFTFLLAFWAGGWSLVSKLFTKRLQFARHLRLALLWVLVMMIADELAKLIAFAINWSALERYGTLLALVGVGVLVAAHLRIVAPRRAPQLAAGVALLTLAGMSAYMLATYGKTRHVSDQHYMSSLYPPGLRLSKGVSAETFAAQVGGLKAALDAQALDPSEEDREYPE